ncbi:MAG: PEP-CTERM sorting domain-containing protein [Candidatus Rokuibacteriota bacterium]
MKKVIGCCALLMLSGLWSTVDASTNLYDNGGPNQVSAFSLSDLLVAEDFVLGGSATLASFQFWDVESAGEYAGSVAWSIYTNSAGLPGVVIAQGSASAAAQITRTSTGLTLGFIYSEFLDDVNMTNSLTSGSLALAAGTYWLALHNGSTADSTFRDFYWETTDNNATIQGVYDDLTLGGLTWVDTLQEHAFIISETSTTVPEPGTLTLTLLGAGLAGVLARRRRSGLRLIGVSPSSGCQQLVTFIPAERYKSPFLLTASKNTRYFHDSVIKLSLLSKKRIVILLPAVSNCQRTIATPRRLSSASCPSIPKYLSSTVFPRSSYFQRTTATPRFLSAVNRSSAPKYLSSTVFPRSSYFHRTTATPRFLSAVNRSSAPKYLSSTVFPRSSYFQRMIVAPESFASFSRLPAPRFLHSIVFPRSSRVSRTEYTPLSVGAGFPFASR